MLYTAIVLPFQVIFSENELAAEFGGGWLGAMHVSDALAPLGSQLDGVVAPRMTGGGIF